MPQIDPCHGSLLDLWVEFLVLSSHCIPSHHHVGIWDRHTHICSSDLYTCCARHVGSLCWRMLMAALWDGWMGLQRPNGSRPRKQFDAWQAGPTLTGSWTGQEYCWIWFRPILGPDYQSLKGMWTECCFSGFRHPSLEKIIAVLHRAWGPLHLEWRKDCTEYGW